MTTSTPPTSSAVADEMDKDEYDLRAILLMLQLEREMKALGGELEHPLTNADVNGARVDLLRAVLGAQPLKEDDGGTGS